MQFQELPLDKRLLSTMEHLGFASATEIQQKAIPVVLAGHDLMASSRTGSGKTLAFLLPAMQRILSRKALSKKDPRVVVLTPTRELAKQVYGQLRTLCANTAVKSTLILGGEDFNEQAKALRRNPHVVVATPGRLADHLSHRHMFLNGLELLIFDEADRMLDLGFSKQLNQINRAADHRLRQTLMFSATMDHAETNQFAADLLNAPKRVAIGFAAEQHADIAQQFYLCDHLDHKQALLERLLQAEGMNQTIIFTATRADTERLAGELAEKGLTTVALSGDLNQSQRNQIMDEFSRGQYQLLVTTDIASRGLDLLNVSHVINFDMPKHAEEYVHRIGRTGRAGAKGDAFSLVGPKDWKSFEAVCQFLAIKPEFSTLEGLEGEFKGFKPKKTRTRAKTGQGKPTGRKPKQAAKAPRKRKATFYDAVDSGNAPVLRRKQAPEQIDRDDEE